MVSIYSTMGSTSPTYAQFSGSEDKIATPYRADQGNSFSPYGPETGLVRGARWALTLAAGRDPGKLYSRSLGDGRIYVWSRRRISPRGVTIGTSENLELRVAQF